MPCFHALPGLRCPDEAVSSLFLDHRSLPMRWKRSSRSMPVLRPLDREEEKNHKSSNLCIPTFWTRLLVAIKRMKSRRPLRRLLCKNSRPTLQSMGGHPTTQSSSPVPPDDPFWRYVACPSAGSILGRAYSDFDKASNGRRRTTGRTTRRTTGRMSDVALTTNTIMLLASC